MRSCRDRYYIQIVFEYLLHLGLLDTAAIFQIECTAHKYYVPSDDFEPENQLKYKLLKHFDEKDGDAFFEAFQSTNFSSEPFPTEIKKLVADIHVYFLASNISKIQGFSKNFSTNSPHVDKKKSSSVSYINPASAPNTPFAQSSIFRLSQFLERNCTNLRDDQEFMPYFSLSFSSSPLHHPLFYQALQDHWVLSLRSRLEKFLWLKYPALKVPDIVLHLPPNFDHKIDEGCYQAQNTSECPERFCSCPDSQEISSLVNIERSSEMNFTGSNFRIPPESPYTDAPIDQGMTHSHDSALFIRRQNQEVRSSGSLSSYHDKHEECQRRYSQLKSKFSELHSDYHNLIGVASELTVALENTARGQQIDLRETLSNCLQIFPELFTKHQDHSRPGNTGIKGRFSLQSSDCITKLDISRIKRHLQERNVKARLLLLQALRWAITRNAYQKRVCIMNQFVSCDLLRLQGDRDSLLVSLLIPPGPGVSTPHPLQQSAARLLNTLASIQSGRSYLAQNAATVNVTAAVLQQRDGILTDFITKSMLVAALQKLSLRRNQRIAMIQAGMVEWLVQQLANEDFESSYSLEYSTALLMNLCLHRSAKEVCLPLSQNVMMVLVSLLSTPITQALPYINGILYSLITDPVLNKTAAELGLAEALEENLNRQNNTEMKKQMEHLLQYHRSLLDHKDVAFTLPGGEGEMMDEDYEELDLLGEELDEQDPVRNIKGELSGEDLLKAHYILPHESAPETISEAEAVLSHAAPLVLRPTTPHHSNQYSSGSSKYYSDQTTSKKQEGKTQDQNSINNWQSRRVSANQDNTMGKSSEVSMLTFETSPELAASQQSFVVCEGGSHRNLPRIAIHLVAKSDESDGDKNYDNDSDDVQVGTMPSGNVHEVHHSHSSIQDVDNQVPAVPAGEESEQKPSFGAESSDTSAFISRPKIPRTPPH